MDTEQLYDGPMGQYVIQIALILLGAFILGYILRLLLNDGLKEQISALEYENSMLKAKSENESSTESEVDEAQLYETIKEQEAKIRDLNDRLSNCVAQRLKVQNALTAAELAIKKSKDSRVNEIKDKDTPLVAATLSPRQTNPVPSPSVKDDLKKIEGVGPKIEQLLNEGGINSYEDVINSTIDDIKDILLKAGPTYAVHDPTTWAEQASLAASGKWDELESLQDELKGGKRK